eukprot:GGOE01002159.1.p1 GENE.GGOE01002159.1~~GGOE01002159.1.p1  ORF type:complete len:1161 (-),score=301.87 GGOE01002159.1:347-3799(-)
MSSELFVAETPYVKGPSKIHGEYLNLNGESWYKIAQYDKMQPFFVSLVSASNFWLYASSNGGLSCGRVSAEHSVFPYYTVDKIHDEHPTTGPKTALIVEKGGKSHLWEPFVFHPSVYKISRNLYKNMLGSMLMYEEFNEDLGLTFSYTWATADKFGIVRKCKLVNHSDEKLKIRVLDGLQNIIAANTDGYLQDCMSNLLDAYKWNELVDEQVGVFCLYAKLSDRAEPLESLKATTVWHSGLPDPEILLSSTQLSKFLKGEPVHQETLIRGNRASFLVHSTVDLKGKESQSWILVAEVDQTHGAISELQSKLASERTAIASLVDADITAGAVSLKKIIGAADGFQCLEDDATSTHHYANVMFNTMRGGIYDKGYIIDQADLSGFVKLRNATVFKQHEAWLAGLPASVNYLEVLAKAQQTNDADLIRICLEYIPVTFSRRHGDPSRPWNRFQIQLKDEEGNRILNYQGNWRDIFQNWEALTISFPYYFESIIAKFINASTVDGYNPYIVNRTDGINWECPEPDHPHANIGYWGDHQIIYLLKLLEWCSKFQPGKLEEDCDKDWFSYANVPYEIRCYEKIVENAKDTITFNWDKHKHIENLKKTMGTDAKLVLNKDGKVVHVNLAEKLLVPLMAKSSNFVIGGGIWLNTQRPEWNDANNAIVGFGLSMVTVYYMRRYVTFLTQLMKSLPGQAINISEEVAIWLAGLTKIYADNVGLLAGDKDLSSQDRRRLLDALGLLASDYRWKVYKNGFSGKKTAVKVTDVVHYLESLQQFIDYSIQKNKKDDGLYHAYNLLALQPGKADIGYLYVMLEGQASALSSGLIRSDAAAALFNHIYSSDLYRPDQHSFMLYPDRKLKGFMERNCIPQYRRDAEGVEFCLKNKLTRILYEDAAGDLRFGATLANANDLKAAIQACANPGIQAHTEELLEIYEEVFVHRAFTGRSGTMFGFEGLGCIYWHMVAKVLLAAQEVTLDAIDCNDSCVGTLQKYYYEARAGIGFNKSPAVYGAFPCDPYSHTPKQAGAQQPGMTGQVKEEVLTRFGELGVRIVKGTILIQPKLLRRKEFLLAPRVFEFVSYDGSLVEKQLQAGELGFTYCQCPFIYKKGTNMKILVKTTTKELLVEGDTLPADIATEIFRRSGQVLQVSVEVPDTLLLDF